MPSGTSPRSIPGPSRYRQEVDELKRRVSDLAAAARDATAGIEADPDRLTAIETRLDKISRLTKKYGVPAAELGPLLDRLRTERSDLANFEDALARHQKESDAARAAYRDASGRLSSRAAARRRRASRRRSQRSSGPSRWRRRAFASSSSPLDSEEPRVRGSEAASFLFAPNPGEPEKPVREDRLGRRAVPPAARHPLRRHGAARGRAHARLRRGGRRNRRAHRGGRRAKNCAPSPATTRSCA